MGDRDGLFVSDDTALCLHCCQPVDGGEPGDVTVHATCTGRFGLEVEHDGDGRLRVEQAGERIGGGLVSTNPARGASRLRLVLYVDVVGEDADNVMEACGLGSVVHPSTPSTPADIAQMLRHLLMSLEVT
jgi:hypothetical protein